MAGHELPRDMPCFRDTDNLVYGRSEAGGVLFGGYEPTRSRAGWTACRGTTPARALPADHERFAQLMEGAARRFPFLDDAGVVALVCHPDAMTPDGNPLLGPMPGVPGFWMAAGLSLNGFGGAGGIGKTIAEWMTAGETELDVHGYRAWRFGAAYRDPRRVEAAGRETYKYYYRLRYPLDTSEWGRPGRVSPAARPHPGPRRGLRREERLGAAGLLPARAGRGGARARTSAPTGGRARPSSPALPSSTRPSASGSASST